MSQANKTRNSKTSLKAILFKSVERFDSFERKIRDYGVDLEILDFDSLDWITYDYGKVDFLIYYPSFEYSSNHPLALQKVYDNLMFINSEYPDLIMFPDPKIIKYYSDKYKQFLFLKKHKYPVPETIPLFSNDMVDLADKRLGYPMVIKNRFGAGGDYVFRVFNKKELLKYYNLSKMNLFNLGSAKHFAEMMSKRIFYYFLIKARNAPYPFLSSPLLAQKYVNLDRDLKTVVGDYKVVEAHWRFQADESMWKVNIDGGGTGVWGKVPQEAIDVSVQLAKDLETRWLNIDMIMDNGKFLITEFSPVWHHYAYKEKPTFVYKDDYNIDVPLEVSLDLERIIVESLIKAASKR